MITKRDYVLSAFACLLLAGGLQAQPGAQNPPRTPGQNRNGMHVYIWARPQVPSARASTTTRSFSPTGASSSPSMAPSSMARCIRPSSADLEHTDVVVIYKGDAGYLSDTERPRSKHTSSAAAAWSVFTTRCAVPTRRISRRSSAAPRSTAK